MDVTLQYDATFSRPNTWMIASGELCARFAIGAAVETTVRTGVRWRTNNRHGVFVSPLDSDLSQWRTEQALFVGCGVRLALVLSGADKHAAAWLSSQ